MLAAAGHEHLSCACVQLPAMVQAASSVTQCSATPLGTLAWSCLQLAWVYLTSIVSHKTQRSSHGGLLLLHCAVWALLGFIASCSLATPC